MIDRFRVGDRSICGPGRLADSRLRRRAGVSSSHQPIQIISVHSRSIQNLKMGAEIKVLSVVTSAGGFAAAGTFTHAADRLRLHRPRGTAYNAPSAASERSMLGLVCGCEQQVQLLTNRSSIPTSFSLVNCSTAGCSVPPNVSKCHEEVMGEAGRHRSSPSVRAHVQAAAGQRMAVVFNTGSRCMRSQNGDSKRRGSNNSKQGEKGH